MNKLIIIAVVAILVIGGIVIFSRGQKKQSPIKPTETEVSESQVETKTETPAQQSQSKTKTLKAADIANAHADYKFSATLPEKWQAQAVTAVDSINIFDSAATGDSDLEKSQIFIRKFSANSFLTLSTVTIYSRPELTVNNRPAVRYDIEKKSGVANFSGQPSWRNKRHIVTDVRVSDASPSVFYVIAKRPDLDDATYQQFLDSLQVIAPIESSSELIEPIDEFLPRITKKPFGIFITPETSPVQPEKFHGYHTAVDVEYEDTNEDIPIRAIADGSVALATTASGYGGVLVIRHTIKGKTHAVIYGHLDPQSLTKQGSQVKAGQQVGMLGDHLTAETDGGRKHLHFGVRADESIDIKGYVSQKDELKGWLDPLELYK